MSGVSDEAPDPSPCRGGHLAQKLQGYQEWVQGADPSCLPSGYRFAGPSILGGLRSGLASLLLPPGTCPVILSPRPQAPTGRVGLGGHQA